MTIPVSARRMPPYAGNGVTTSFAYNFYISADSELLIVEEDDVTEVRSTLVLDTDYTVTGVGAEAGGNVVLTDPLATGKTLYVIGNTPLTQPTDFKNQSSWQGKRVESSLDRIEGQIQELSSLALKADDRVSLDYDAGGRDIIDIGGAYVDELYIGGVLVVPEDMAFSLPDPTGNANEFVVGNAGGTAYETKTHAEADIAKRSETPIKVSAIADMKALTGLVDGAVIVPKEFYSGDGFQPGLREFIVDATPPPDDGGSVIHDDAGVGYFKLKHSWWVSARDWGAVGDNSADDYSKLQAALDYVGSYRGLWLIIPTGKYKISQGLVFEPASVPAALPGSDIHFSDHVESRIVASGDAKIIASASMTNMLLIQFNASTSSIAPFYSSVENIEFDGAGLATTGIKSDFCMHLTLSKNKIHNVTNGIDYVGYGIADISRNVIKADYCINFGGGGGDSSIMANDLYPLTDGRGVNIAKLGSNVTVSRNIFSGEGETNVYGVYLDGTANTSSDLIINVRVLNNEFSGMKAGVYGERHPSGRNIHGIKIADNHTVAAAGGAVNTGSLCHLVGVDDAEIYDNQINGVSLAATISTDPGILLEDCRRPKVKDNKAGNLLGPFLYMTDTDDGVFSGNEAIDTARSGSGAAVWDIDTGCDYNILTDNVIKQSSASFGQTSIIERAGSNNNNILRTFFSGCNRPTKNGAATLISGNILATGNISLSGAVLTILSNSSGFSAVRNSAGVVTVTLAEGAYNTSNYRVKCVADLHVTVDTQTTSTFIIRTFAVGTSTPTDAALIQFEVTG